jgi:hypothetical protein
MQAIKNIQTTLKDAYIVTIIALLGIFAFISAVLIAWPALAYLGSKLF